MNSENQSRSSGLQIANWVVLSFNVALILYVAHEILAQRALLDAQFALDEFEMPFVTRVALATPQWLIRLTAGAAIVALAVKEVLFGWKAVKLIVNLAVFVGVFYVLEAFHAAVVQLLLQVS